jgi:hypothetical protein
VNSQEILGRPKIRSFTRDTIPFSVADSRGPEFINEARINLQECLVDAFLILNQPFEASSDYKEK